MSEQLVGGYTVHREVGEGELELFKAVFGQICGVHRELLAVASQLVNGTNYILIYSERRVVAHPVTELKVAKGYVPFEHGVKPVVNSISTIDVTKL